MRTASVTRALGVLLLLAGAAPAGAQAEAGSDPWEPATEAAAEAAVAQLGAKRALELKPAVLKIQGLTGGVAGGGTGIRATVRELEQAKRALGAEETDLEVRVELPADVLFAFDKSDIRPDAASSLAKVATLIRAYPSGRVLLEGHTDSVSTEAYNQKLSEARAAAVKRWLVEKEGIEAARLETRGAGESRPVADNGTEPGRQKNRRVEVVIRKK